MSLLLGPGQTRNCMPNSMQGRPSERVSQSAVSDLAQPAKEGAWREDLTLKKPKDNRLRNGGSCPLVQLEETAHQMFSLACAGAGKGPVGGGSTR